MSFEDIDSAGLFRMPVCEGLQALAAATMAQRNTRYGFLSTCHLSGMRKSAGQSATSASRG